MRPHKLQKVRSNKRGVGKILSPRLYNAKSKQGKEYQKARIGGGYRKFSIMVELPGPQNRKIVESLVVKFAQKGLFLKIFFAAHLAPRPILRFTTTLYIKFDHMRHFFSKFRNFRKIFTVMRNLFEIWTPKTPKKLRKTRYIF